MASDLKQLETAIRRERANPVEKDVEAFATERIQAFRKRARRLRRSDAFREFVLDYIDEARQAARRNERDDPLCECGTLCPIKRGDIPPAVLLEDDFHAGVSRLKQQHRGRPVVVLEAASEFADYYAETLTIGEEALVSLRRDEIFHLDGTDSDRSESSEVTADA
jgi:hypothetical protein